MDERTEFVKKIFCSDPRLKTLITTFYFTTQSLIEISPTRNQFIKFNVRSHKFEIKARAQIYITYCPDQNTFKIWNKIRGYCIVKRLVSFLLLSWFSLEEVLCKDPKESKSCVPSTNKVYLFLQHITYIREHRGPKMPQEICNEISEGMFVRGGCLLGKRKENKMMA